MQCGKGYIFFFFLEWWALMSRTQFPNNLFNRDTNNLGFLGLQMNKLYCNSRTQWTLVLCFIPKGSAGNDMEAEGLRSCCHDNSQRSMWEWESAVLVKAKENSESLSVQDLKSNHVNHLPGTTVCSETSFLRRLGYSQIDFNYLTSSE